MQNCIFEPIIPGNDNECILDMCAPPELHLIQGIVKHVYDNIYNEWSGVTIWLDLINIKKYIYHYGTFVGNNCFKRLKNIDKLQLLTPLNM